MEEKDDESSDDDCDFGDCDEGLEGGKVFDEK